ncbi:hypothetical protein PHLGIDRAFT_76108, partial [Phlebiopsis gigantea 11061_1 CR5-6]
GNAAFKAGDFPAAIGHYTAAVIADPKNPTYTLNRAAAYLKLGKHVDAERDCDATIKLDSKNVKAWFRRGQARSGQEKFMEAREGTEPSAAPDPTSQHTTAPVVKQSASKNTPLSLFNFVRSWDALSSPQARWTFLESVHPTSLPSLFKTSLETPLLVKMLETFKVVLDNAPEVEVKESIKTYLLNMARVPRFTTIVLFMSKIERQLVKEVWDGVDAGDDQVERGARKVWGVS